MSAVISVENVSKSYRLGMIGGATLKEDFARWWAKRRGKADPSLMIGEEHHARFMGEEFWALRDVSFTVAKGEVLGIIGRNGAGKSTLLKILSQVTAPSSGEIKIEGRIASLLEVGTGFHPELTGRENIFLNGAILGMMKAEIRSKFDEIVAFSGVEEFIDTPVKRYSSGMYVRLAFAVAAHLEPEILIVDEVLAVGDAEFQKKCLGKMHDVSKSGRTVLFVSHNTGAVSALCNQVAYLENGRLKALGPTAATIAQYHAIRTVDPSSDLKYFRRSGFGKEAYFISAQMLVESGQRPDQIEFGENLTLSFVLCARHELRNLSIGCSIFTEVEACVGSLITKEGFSLVPNEPAHLQFTLKLPNLAPGHYYLGYSIGQGGGNGGARRDYDIIVGYPSFEVLSFSKRTNSSIAHWSNGWGSIVFDSKDFVLERVPITELPVPSS